MLTELVVVVVIVEDIFILVLCRATFAALFVNWNCHLLQSCLGTFVIATCLHPRGTPLLSMPNLLPKAKAKVEAG